MKYLKLLKFIILFTLSFLAAEDNLSSYYSHSDFQIKSGYNQFQGDFGSVRTLGMIGAKYTMHTNLFSSFAFFEQSFLTSQTNAFGRSVNLRTLGIGQYLRPAYRPFGHAPISIKTSNRFGYGYTLGAKEINFLINGSSITLTGLSLSGFGVYTLHKNYFIQVSLENASLSSSSTTVRYLEIGASLGISF